MDDRAKRKQQLIEELTRLRQRVAELEQASCERRQSLEPWQDSQNFLERVLDGIPEVTIVIDRVHRIVFANRAARQWAGVEDFAAGGLKCHQMLHHRDDPCEGDGQTCPMDRVLETRGPVTVTHTHFAADGRQTQVEVSAAPLLDDAGQVTAMIESCRDVTELQAAQQRLVQAERLAAIGEAMTGLAHESRNALQRSQACLEDLAARLEDRPEAMDLINRIQQAQDHLHHLYEEVREYAAPVVLQPSLQDLSSLMREAWDGVTVMQPGRSARLREATDADLDLRCEVDAFAMGQVFRNILENALDACADPAVVEVAYSPVQVLGGECLQIRIRDHGPGLTPEQQRRIFDSFYTTKTKGTGLGMPIAKRLVEAHGGRILAASATGGGAEILVILPRSL